jgi:uncharacterized protein with von Willebrand factor type A (vWA) domain
MNALPFSEFLELLRARGLGVSLHEHVSVGKLLARWDSTSREEFRDALAALIARNEAEIYSIRGLFDEFYPAPLPDQPAKPKARVPAVWKYGVIQVAGSARAWRIAAALVAAISAAGLTVWYYTDTQIPRLPAPPAIVPPLASRPQPFEPGIQSVPETLVQVASVPATELPPPPSRVDWRLLGALTAAALVVSMIVLWGGRLRARARQWTADAWQSALASIPGPYHGRLVLTDLVYRLPRQDLDEAATLLARSFSRAGRGRQLDVQRSLRETLRAGMRPLLIFRPRRVQETILLLQDVSQSMTVHSRRVESFVSDLLRQGVALERWYFHGDVSVTSQRPDGPPVALEALARRREDWPLMVISAGIGVTATLTKTDRTWMAACRSWSRRVWMSPILDAQLWPEAMRALPLTVLPMTRAGLLQAANILAHGEHAAVGALSRVRAATVPVTVAHVELLERLACLVPNPTLDYLELLRQKFAPDVPESAVLHVATDVAAYAGMPIKMTDGEIRDHLRRVRKDAPELEARVRKYLLKVLNDSEPAEGSTAHMRWEIAAAVQKLQIAEISSADASAELAALGRLAKGPLWHELRDSLQRLPLSGPLSGEIRKATGLHGESDEPPPFRSASWRFELGPFRWAAPRWQDMAAATSVALIVGSAGSLSGAFRVQASHALDAYMLEYRPSQALAQAGELRITSRSETPNLPSRVQLYRDAAVLGVPIDLAPGAGAIVPIDAGGDAHVYQVRAALPGGALALSNTLLAPSVLISIDAQPWARVTIRAQNPQIPEMTQTTPAAVRLPEGTYDLTFENGGLTGARSERIQVTSTGQRVFRYDMPNFNPAQIVNDLKLVDTVGQPALKK